MAVDFCGHLQPLAATPVTASDRSGRNQIARHMHALSHFRANIQHRLPRSCLHICCQLSTKQHGQILYISVLVATCWRPNLWFFFCSELRYAVGLDAVNGLRRILAKMVHLRMVMYCSILIHTVHVCSFLFCFQHQTNFSHWLGIRKD